MYENDHQSVPRSSHELFSFESVRGCSLRRSLARGHRNLSKPFRLGLLLRSRQDFRFSSRLQCVFGILLMPRVSAMLVSSPPTSSTARSPLAHLHNPDIQDEFTPYSDESGNSDGEPVPKTCRIADPRCDLRRFSECVCVCVC